MMKCTGIAFIIASLTCVEEQPQVIDSFCQRAAIIQPAQADTFETKRQILIHNRKVKRCPVSAASPPKAPLGREIKSPAAKPKKRNFSRYAVGQ
jgi:hypothetical protein